MEIYKYGYQIKNLVITTVDNTFQIRDGSVTYFNIHHDYKNRKMPVIKMDIELGIEVLSSIYRDTDKAILSLDLYEQQFDKNEKVINTTLYMQHAFTIVPAKDQMNFITSEDSTTQQLTDEMKNLQLFELYLIDMKAVKWFSQQITNIYRKASKPAVLQSLLQMRDVPGNLVIASPPMDNKIIDYMVMPLGDLVGNINYINTIYGLYNSIPWIYYDILRLYIINWINPNIILPTATDYGNIVFLMMNADKPDRQVEGSCNDAQSKTHYINLNTTPFIDDRNDKVKSTKFATIATVDLKGDVKKTSLGGTSDDTKLTYIYNQNEMTTDQMVNENMRNKVVTVIANSVSVAFMAPYKTVTFELDTQFLNIGLAKEEYRISGWSLSLTREGQGVDSKYIHSMSAELIKPTE